MPGMARHEPEYHCVPPLPQLLQLDEAFGLLAGVHHVVDLCAAPGSWSQVWRNPLFERCFILRGPQDSLHKPLP